MGEQQIPEYKETLYRLNGTLMNVHRELVRIADTLENINNTMQIEGRK